MDVDARRRVVFGGRGERRRGARKALEARARDILIFLVRLEEKGGR